MTTTLRDRLLLPLVLGALLVPAAAQSSTGAMQTSSSGLDRFDVAANFSYKVAKISETTNRFVLPGGAADAVFNFRGKANGLGLALDVDGESRSGIETGVGLTQFSIAGGPRYTFCLACDSPHSLWLYGQVMGGEVFASNSLFPAPGAAKTSASSSVFQAGGGANLRLTPSIYVRLVGADWMVTALPNAADNKQYDVRFENGVVFRF
jgi:hypothetical protein